MQLNPNDTELVTAATNVPICVSAIAATTFLPRHEERRHCAPALTSPLASVAEVRVDKYVLGRRLVVQFDTGKVHSFEIHTASGIWLDKPATQAACDFIQSKIKSTQLKK